MLPNRATFENGSNGVEAGLAEMLMRMYVRWAERHEYKVEVLDRTDGEQAGIKSE